MKLILLPTNKVVAESLKLIRYETEFTLTSGAGDIHKVTLSDFNSLRVNYQTGEITALISVAGALLPADLSVKKDPCSEPVTARGILRHIEVTYNKGSNEFIYYKVGNEKLNRKIISAAVAIDDVDKTLVVPSVRHYDNLSCNVLDRIYTPERWLELKKDNRVTQGFVDNTGEFWGREQALTIALAAGQLKCKHSSADELYSEDLY